MPWDPCAEEEEVPTCEVVERPQSNSDPILCKNLAVTTLKVRGEQSTFACRRCATEMQKADRSLLIYEGIDRSDDE